MVTIDPADEAPEELTGAEFVEYMKNKKPVPTARVAEDEEVEPIAKPAIKGKRVGEVGEFKSRGIPAEDKTGGIDASKETFMQRHPKLAKAVDVGKKVVGKVDEFIDEEMIHHGAAERKKPTGEEQKEEEKKVKEKKKKTQKKLTGIEKGLKKGLLGDEDEEDEDDEDDYKKSKRNKKSQILSRGYESAYSPGGGIGGTRGYEAAYKGAVMGGGSYQPAYKTPTKQPSIEQPPAPRVRVKESEVEEMPQRAPIPKRPEPDRFNIQNWQSMGFPNTMPQSARGNLFRPAPPRPQPQPQVVPMVRQPYQPREPMPQMRAPARAPMLGAMPRISLNLNTMPQIMRPKSTIAPPRAQAPTGTNGGISIPSTTFFGVNLNEKKKSKQKPITNMGAGYKNVPLLVMNGVYPEAKYDPKKDPITKKSIIPKIGATITPNNFTMFGTKMKNRKI